MDLNIPWYNYIPWVMIYKQDFDPSKIIPPPPDDAIGNTYNDKELIDMIMNDPKLKSRSLTFLAKFAEGGTRASLEHPRFKEAILKCDDKILPNQFEAICNTAYICLYSKDIEIKQSAYKQLKSWWNSP